MAIKTTTRLVKHNGLLFVSCRVTARLFGRRSPINNKKNTKHDSNGSLLFVGATCFRCEGQQLEGLVRYVSRYSREDVSRLLLDRSLLRKVVIIFQAILITSFLAHKS